MITLTLYSTVDCHLCDEAQILLQASVCAEDFILQKSDIRKDKSLLIKYRYTIPVVACDERELAWPFDREKFEAWFVSLNVK